MADSSPTQLPNLNPYSNTNGNGSVEGAKNSVLNTAQQTMDSIRNNETVQNLSNGPMADKTRAEAATTKSEFSNLASARTTPNSETATGQSLTHYHSFFYNLLSWENPRATALSYVAIVLFIFATRYVPVVRYWLKGTYMILGIMAAAEVAGKLIMGEGFATKMRPKRYYTIPRETLESMMEDLVEFGNFFVIEFQRIVFAENIYFTVGAFVTCLITYFLIKITPAWGLALLFTTLGYFVPLAYIQNQEFVDTHLSNAQSLISQQANQVRDMAAEHTNKAKEMSQNALKDYGARAQEMVGTAKKAAVDKGYVSQETAAKVPGGGASEVTKEDFPAAPNADPVSSITHDGAADESTPVKAEEKEPLLA